MSDRSRWSNDVVPFWPELRRGSERLMLGDGEDQQEAFAAPEVVVSDGGVVLLTRRVQDVDLDVLAVQDHLLPVAVGLGGLVVLHELRTKQSGQRRSKGGGGQRATEGIRLTSSYMNCSVSADFPTPPLPTMITLCNTSDVWFLFLPEAMVRFQNQNLRPGRNFQLIN